MAFIFLAGFASALILSPYRVASRLPFRVFGETATLGLLPWEADLFSGAPDEYLSQFIIIATFLSLGMLLACGWHLVGMYRNPEVLEARLNASFGTAYGNTDNGMLRGNHKMRAFIFFTIGGIAMIISRCVCLAIYQEENLLFLPTIFVISSVGAAYCVTGGIGSLFLKYPATSVGPDETSG
jgi:hypothetical protein